MNRKAITASDRVAAKAIHDAIGGRPEVRRYRDDSETWYVDMASFADRPGEELTTYSTIGVHAYPNAVDGRDIPTELSIVAATSATSVPNMLVEAAFLIMKDKWICAPGVVFPNLVAEYAPSLVVPSFSLGAARLSRPRGGPAGALATCRSHFRCRKGLSF